MTEFELEGPILLKILFVLYFRGPVVRVDSAGPSTGGILLSPDKRRLVWDIGQFVGIVLFFGFYGKIKSFLSLSFCKLVISSLHGDIKEVQRQHSQPCFVVSLSTRLTIA